MNQREALEEAKRRWGATGAIQLRAPSTNGGTGRLARYRYIVGNGRLGAACSLMGQGNSWVEAFEDVRPRPPRASGAGRNRE
ncbi:MAG: hypothetical protein JNK82_15165 [Myxococcaceae bacterium]|nr:hypothetical protein [Myxococcaceae bacterium]